MNVYALGSTAVIISGTNRAQMLTGRSIHCMFIGRAWLPSMLQ